MNNDPFHHFDPSRYQTVSVLPLQTIVTLAKALDGAKPDDAPKHVEQLRQRYGECPHEVSLELQRDGQTREIALEIRRDRTWKLARNSEELRLPRHPISDPASSDSASRRSDELAGLGSIADHVRCRDPDHCEVSMALVEAYRANRGSFARQARIVPAVRDGEMIGYKFYGLRPGSLPKLLGLKNGDLLESIDGKPLRDEDMLSQLERLAKLRRGDRVQLSFVRKGETRKLELELVKPFAAQK